MSDAQASERKAVLPDGDEFYTSATVYRDAVLYWGNIHWILLAAIQKDFPDASMENCVDGYVTKRGRFITCEEAKVLATELDIVRPGHDKAIDPKMRTEYFPHWVLSNVRTGDKTVFKTDWKIETGKFIL